MTAVAALAFLAFSIFAGMSIFAIARKNRSKLKRNSLIAVACFVVSVIAIGASGSIVVTPKEEVVPVASKSGTPATKKTEPAQPTQPIKETPVVEAPAAEEAKPEEPAPVVEPAVEPKKEPVAEPAPEPAIAGDWQTEIEKIVSSDGSANEKSDAAITLARSYKPTADEQKQFEEYIVSEYKSGNYLSGLSDEKYAVTNIFKSSVVERQYKESAQTPIQKFAYDFNQNVKDAFRGINDSIESNEGQMEKALTEMK